MKFAESCIAQATKAGVKTVILADWEIWALSETKDSLIGNGKRFASEVALDTYIQNCLDDYWNLDLDENGQRFVELGVQLKDEPTYEMATAYGQVYNSILRVCEKNGQELYIHYNFFPLAETAHKAGYYTANRDTTLSDAYFAYLQSFIVTMNVEKKMTYINFDSYPITPDGIAAEHVLGLQIGARVAKENGLELHNVLQTSAFGRSTANGTDLIEPTELVKDRITEKDAVWMNNLALAFGVKGFSYYTYFTKQMRTEGEYPVDDASFINSDGKKTDLYYFMQKIIAQNQSFASLYFNFEYQNSAIRFVGDKPAHLGMAISDTGEGFTGVKKYTIHEGCGLLTEHYDATNNIRMYAMQNIADPRTDEGLQTASLQFVGDYKYAMVIQNGKTQFVSLNDGRYETSLSAGEAVFVIPY